VIAVDDDGTRIAGPFFPHPDCHRHLPFEGSSESGPQLPVGPLSPLKSLWLEPTAEGAPAIAGAIIESPANVDPPEELVGRGIDWDPTLARLKATMEALERYCASRPVRAPVRSAEGCEILERRTRLPMKISETKLRWWAELERLGEGGARLVPLEYLQLGSKCRIRDPLVRADTTGMAAHPLRDAAVEIGLAEVVERAGLKTLWMTTIQWVWDKARLPTDLAPWIAIIERLGYDVLMTATSPVPGFVSCACFLVRRGEGPALVCGSGGGRTSLLAAERALTEAYAQLHQAKALAPTAPLPGLPRPYDHFLYFLDPAPARGLLESWGVARAPRVDFFEPVSRSAPPEFLVADRGNVLTDHLGVSVIQVVAPMLEPLDFETRGTAPWPTPFG
jgi:hypothetical protein